jgi:hypothetical protein
MKSKLEELLGQGKNYIINSSETILNNKSSITKWSKKEILGHLIDSGINNLQRFTQIQFENKPFLIQRYNQNELVKANNYQGADTIHLLKLWLSLNDRILNVMAMQTEESLSYEIIFEDGNKSDLKFLMKDYIDHLEHHLNQIMS